MERKYFGTDGIRGSVGRALITPEFMLKLGWAAGRVMACGGRRKVLIGKDTRVSGYMLESALAAGLSAAGVDVHYLGPMPTPGVAYLTQTLRADAGIVISASHNPYEDNGIKFFSSQGTKLGDDIESLIEKEIENPLVCVPSKNLGKANRIEDAQGRYIEFCKSTFPSMKRLRGLKIVVDCANGATYQVAPNVFAELGAEVVTIGDTPDGFNINKNCGSTSTDKICQKVLEEKADVGIALDGDGDRVIMVDRFGTVVTGDELLYIIAKERKRKGRLKGGVVGTIMSNFALENALRKEEIAFIRTRVGDRYVLEGLKSQKWRIGGESSGHIVCLDKTTTGDGIVSALQVLSPMIAQQKSLDELLSDLVLNPQVLVNVSTANPVALADKPEVQALLHAAEQALNQRGRILIRPSGTEPVLRVMVEGEDEKEVKQLAVDIADKIQCLESQEVSVL